MSRVDTRQAPYYDDFDASKQYYKLLAIPGRVAQAREITQLQSVMQEIMKSIGDSILSNGDVVEGCQVIVASDKKSVTVTSGKVYMEGIVTPVQTTSVPITGEGVETIGVKIREIIITEDDDPTLKDPAQGYDNYGQAGCNRLRRELIVVANDPDASIIAQIVDGALSVETYAPTYDTLTQTLARRTYDESGSYLVNGLKVHVESKTPTHYNVVVEAGKAYVLGYELKIPTARRIETPRSTSTTTIEASNYVYHKGTNRYQIDSNPYVQEIRGVRCRVDTIEQQVLSTNVDSVLLSQTDVVTINKVYQGSIQFTIGATSTDGDCYLSRNGSRYYVKWNGGNAPNPGQSYTVEYEYNRDLDGAKDYELQVEDAGSYLVFKEGADTPLEGTNFSITYDQYLARRDIVYMDQNGDIAVLQGAPDEVGFEVTPSAPVNTLPLAQIFNPPNGSPESQYSSLNIHVFNIGLTRFTMNDIQTIVDRVKKTEYNQAVASLNDDARSRSTINAKKGLLTDPLVDFSRIDLYYNKDYEGNAIDPNKPLYTMAIDLDKGIGYLPVNVYSYIPEVQNYNSTKLYKRLVTLDSTGEKVTLEQANATSSFQINPYSVFPQLPEVLVTPAVDSWVEDTVVQVPVSLSNSTIVNTTTSVLYKTARKSTSGRDRVETTTSSTYKDVATGTTTSTSVTDSIISEEAITYMRQRELTVEGKNYPPGVDNIRCTFDGVNVALTPAGGTAKGTEAGTVKADDNGYVKATFTIPKNVRTGIREVKMWTDVEVAGYQTTGYTLFQSSGMSRTIQQTITTLTTVLLQREVTTTVLTTTYVDPVGQTFVLDKLSILKGIDIFFESKPTTNDSVIVEIRGVTNGTIDGTIFAHTQLNASQVHVSNDGTVATRFNFDDPVVLEANTEYAFVVRSLSDKYRIWVSEIGGTDVKTGEIILKNSYMTGVMMSSSNNSTWTAHQTMDVKFRLIEDIYEQSGSIVFNPIPADQLTRLDLTADSAVLNNTAIKWYYSINGGASYHSITPYSLRELGDVAEEVLLRADFSRSTDENITPLLAMDTLLLIGSSYRLEGKYIGVNVVGIDSYKNVSVILDVLTPAGTSIDIGFSTDNGETIIPLTNDQTQTKILDSGWRELIYKGSIPEGKTATACRIFIDAKSNSSIFTPKFSAVKILMD